MRNDGPSTETMNILDHVASTTAEWIRRRFVEVQCDDVSVRRRDLHGVDDEHTMPVRRRIRGSRGVAVVGQDDEAKAGARRGARNLVDGLSAVRATRVNVIPA